MKLRNLLALALGLLLALTPLSAALAEKEDTDQPVTISISERTPAEQRTQERDVGDITVTGGGIAAAQVSVKVEGQGTIRAEDITVEATKSATANGAQVSATAPRAQATVEAKKIAATAETKTANGAQVSASASGAQATVEAGEIAARSENGTATGAQISATASEAQATVEAKKIAATAENAPAYGAQIEASNGGKAAVTADTLTATSAQGHTRGVSAKATDGGTATVQITGQDGVQVEGRTMSFGMSLTARGTDAVIEAQVAGDIAVQSLSNARGASVTAFTGGEIELVCGGSVLAEGNGAIGLDVGAVEGCVQATATVAGDVKATGTGAVGLSVSAFDTGTAEVLVEGTISGAAAAVEVLGEGTAEAATLTVWALEGEIVGTREGNAEAFAKNIQYILKADPVPGGDVALDGATKYKDFNVATEDTTVTVRPTLAKGYKLLGVSNNGTALEQDEDGNYFLVVPRGGGVYLTVKVNGPMTGSRPPKKQVSKAKARCLQTVRAKDMALAFYDDGTCEFYNGARYRQGTYGFEQGRLVFQHLPATVEMQGDATFVIISGNSFYLTSAVLRRLMRAVGA